MTTKELTRDDEDRIHESIGDNIGPYFRSIRLDEARPLIRELSLDPIVRNLVNTARILLEAQAETMSALDERVGELLKGRLDSIGEPVKGLTRKTA